MAGSLKLTYSQYRELQSFSQFGSDVDKDTKDRLALGERVVEVLKQNRNSPVDVADQVMIIYAVNHGFLDEVELAKVSEYESELRSYASDNKPEISEKIHSTGALDEETENSLKELLEEFTKRFLNK